jgi:transcriptional regulator with XRE-family HTH domain
MDVDKRLGESLRVRRGLVRPEDHGMPAGGTRRTPGLRREEIAMLAGVSTDYYIRLEQGRDRRPSAQVVDAFADALALDEDAVAHLREPARPATRSAPQLRPLLGEDALNIAYAKLDALRRDFDGWKDLTLSVGYPQ